MGSTQLHTPCVSESALPYFSALQKLRRRMNVVRKGNAMPGSPGPPLSCHPHHQAGNVLEPLHQCNNIFNPVY
eukprot:scaffold135546_cov21-Tisochrysis_lutea.AAC.1